MRRPGAGGAPLLRAPTPRALAGRALVLWILVRAVLWGFGAALGDDPPTDPATALDPITSLLAIGATVLLLDVDLRATREATFVANLGIGRRHVAVVAAAVALGMEVALALAFSWAWLR